MRARGKGREKRGVKLENGEKREMECDEMDRDHIARRGGNTRETRRSNTKGNKKGVQRWAGEIDERGERAVTENIGERGQTSVRCCERDV
jgi:hypothetical protein